MNFEDEKDYIMRIIKEMVRVLFSLMLGKKYTSIEQEAENGYEVSGKKLDELLIMVDNGEINEDFLQKSNYSKEEVLDGITYIMKESGYNDIVRIVEQL